MWREDPPFKTALSGALKLLKKFSARVTYKPFVEEEVANFIVEGTRLEEEGVFCPTVTFQQIFGVDPAEVDGLKVTTRDGVLGVDLTTCSDGLGGLRNPEGAPSSKLRRLIRFREELTVRKDCTDCLMLMSNGFCTQDSQDTRLKTVAGRSFTQQGIEQV